MATVTRVKRSGGKVTITKTTNGRVVSSTTKSDRKNSKNLTETHKSFSKSRSSSSPSPSYTTSPKYLSDKSSLVVGFTRDPKTGAVVDTMQNVSQESKQQIIEASNKGRVYVTAAKRDEQGRLNATSVAVKEKVAVAEKQSQVAKHNPAGSVVGALQRQTQTSSASNVYQEDSLSMAMKNRYVPPTSSSVPLEEKKFFDKVKSGYLKAEGVVGDFLFEKDVSGRTRFNPKPFRWVDEKTGMQAQSDAFLLENMKAQEDSSFVPLAVRKGLISKDNLARTDAVFEDLSEGVRSEIAARPIATAAQFAAGYGVAKVAQGSGAIALKLAPKFATSSVVKGSLIGLQAGAGVVYGLSAATNIANKAADGMSVAKAIGQELVPVLAFTAGAAAVPSAKLNPDSYNVAKRTSVTNKDGSVTIFERGSILTKAGVERKVSTRIVIPKKGEGRFFTTLRNAKGKVLLKDSGVYVSDSSRYLYAPTREVMFETSAVVKSSKTGKSASILTEGKYDLYPQGTNLYEYSTSIGNKDIFVKGISKVTSKGKVVVESFSSRPMVGVSTTKTSPVAKAAYSYVTKKYPVFSSGAARGSSSDFFTTSNPVFSPAAPSLPASPVVTGGGFDVVSILPSPIKGALMLPLALGGSSAGSDVEAPSIFEAANDSRFESKITNEIELRALTEGVVETAADSLGVTSSSSSTKPDVATEAQIISEPVIDSPVEAVIEPVTSIVPVLVPVPEIPIPLILPTLTLNRKVVSAGAGFDVFVRKRGVFVKASSFALSKKDALDFGAFTVHNTARATFDVRPSNSPLSSAPLGSAGSFNRFRSNFYKKGGLFIEKRNKRITSAGERAEITSLGIAAIKSGKKSSKKGKKRKGLFSDLKVF